MTRRIRLTDLAVRALKSTGGQLTYWDHITPAFGVRVGALSKSFVVVRDGGHRVTIGRYPEMSLQDARTEAKRILALSSIPRAISNAPTMSQAVALFLETRAQRNRAATKVETERIFRKHLLPELEQLKIADVTTHQLTRIIDQLMETPATANHVFTAARTFFNWSVARRYITQSPLAGLPLPTKPGKRDRVLSDTELFAVYRAAIAMGHPFGHIVMVCIHTGMRRSEVAALKWSYITQDCITIPGDMTKNGQQHILPNLIGERLTLIPRVSDYLFPSAVDTPFSAWSKNKIKLDKRCGLNDWVIHDLRRTFSTKLAEWQLAPPHVIERLLNHASGTMSPLARIYNRATYFAEMKTALELYEKKLVLLSAT